MRGSLANAAGRVLLNLNDRCVEAPLIVELGRSREGKGLVLGIRRSFRQNLGGFVESTLRLEGQCLQPECGLVPGCHLQGAIKDRPRFVITTDTLECIGQVKRMPMLRGSNCAAA
jgi:hypothetical protein